MKTIYFDNAATTPMHKEVIEIMKDSMTSNYGNPSSIHQTGRKAKDSVETARKKIADYFNISSNQLIFTSGGTEANNLILNTAVKNLGIKRIITSKIEHHAVLNVVDELHNKFATVVEYVDLDEKGGITLKDLERKLSKKNDKTMVSLMWINNEIGNILPIGKVAELCQKYQAVFHSDAVQAVGHLDIDLKKNPIDFLTASAHKFHGPKGIGFLCYNKKHSIKPMILGGGQEKGIRSGTENVHSITGMQKALDISLRNLKEDEDAIFQVKRYFINQLCKSFPDIEFNGYSQQKSKSSYTIVNVRFPVTDNMMLFKLDLLGVCASGGSACQSGGMKTSHVLKEILNDEEIKKSSIRFSFSKYSKKEDVDFVIEKLKKIER